MNRSFLVFVALACALRGQESAPAGSSATPPSAELRAAIEAYLDEISDGVAAGLLEKLVARKDADGYSVLEALKTCSVPLAATMEDLVPYRDQHLMTRAQLPSSHARTGPRRPIVFDISGGGAVAHLKLDDAIVCFVHGETEMNKYTPPEFSDEGRDGFLKVLRRTCHRAHGDPNRMWLCGFSWAGHACFDTAMHRPDVVRGIIPLAGAPRHVAFRLLPNLRTTEVDAFTGKKDDPILVWNLEEVGRLANAQKLVYRLTTDPEAGHTLPLRGIDTVAKTVSVIPPRDDGKILSGVILGDSALVEGPFLRMDAIDASRVKEPDRITVQPGLSEEELRRVRIKSVEKKVVKLTWSLETAKGGASTLSVVPDGVTGFTIFLREPWFTPGQHVTVRAKGKTLFNGALVPDPQTLLSEARRTGERLRPTFRAIQVR